MPIHFTIGNLVNDQSSGIQDNDVNVTLTGGELDGLDPSFEAFLAGLGLSAAQKAFAVDGDGGSASALIQVSASGGETINDLKLIADPNSATGWTTLAGDPLYLHVDATGNFATLTTVPGAGGMIYAAFALVGEAIDNVLHMASAGVQTVMFAPIHHGDASDPDDRLPLGDVMQIGCDTAMSFDFHQLAAGNFLWAAVGNASGAMLITGQDLNVIDTPGKLGDKVNSGSSDPTDTVNTSKATETTIGVNAQHFAPTNSGDGAVAVMTFVSGLAPLGAATPQYTGQNILQVDYADYVNVGSAAVFVSQLTGGTSAKIKLSLLEAGGGGGGGDHVTSDLQPEEGYNADATNRYSYIGNQDSDSNLKDDWPVAIATVSVRGFTWDGSTSGSTHNGVTVTITGNSVIVDGAHANDLIGLTAANDPGDSLDGTFNRIDIQAMSGSASFDIGHIDLTSGGLAAAGLGSHLFADDDGPAIDLSADVLAPNDLQVSNRIDATGHDESAFVLRPGSDGMGSFTLVGPEDSSGDLQWRYDGASHSSITGTYLGHDLYTLALNPDGSYDFDMIGLLPGDTLDLNPAEVIKAGAPDAPILEIGAKDSDAFVRMSGGGGNINESHGVVGVTNGNLDFGESLTFTLFDGTDQLTFQGIQIGTKSAQGGIYSFTYHIAGTPADEMHQGSDEMVVKNGVIDISSADLGGATIDLITIMKETGSAIKIGIADIHIIIEPEDVQLGFTVALTDGDGDLATRGFVVDIDGNNDGVFDAAVNALAAISSGRLIDPAFDALRYQPPHDYFLV